MLGRLWRLDGLHSLDEARDLIGWIALKAQQVGRQRRHAMQAAVPQRPLRDWWKCAPRPSDPTRSLRIPAPSSDRRRPHARLSTAPCLSDAAHVRRAWHDPRTPVDRIALAGNATAHQRDALVDQQRVPRRHRHHKRIAPGRHGDNSVAHFVGLRETHVIEVIMQSLDLLR